MRRSDLQTVRDYLEWQHAINGGFQTLDAHLALAREGRPKPTLDEALAALGRVEEADDEARDDARERSRS